MEIHKNSHQQLSPTPSLAPSSSLRRQSLCAPSALFQKYFMHIQIHADMSIDLKLISIAHETEFHL